MTGATNISFNGNSLQTNGPGFQIITGDIDHYSDPTKSSKMYPLAHANQSVIPFIEYPSKTINVTGKLLDTSIAALDADIDTFKSWFAGLQNANKALVIDYDGSSRQYTATANKVLVKRPIGLLYANFSLAFDCPIPFGSATASTTAINQTGRTLNQYIDSVTFVGSAPVQLPIITITLTAVSDASGGYIFYGNASNGQGIYVNRTWSVNDVLVIDTTQQTVTVNGAPIAFSGAFPEFQGALAGAQSLAYQDNFTSRTFNITVTYTALYE